jgi:hypothetical protein
MSSSSSLSPRRYKSSDGVCIADELGVEGERLSETLLILFPEYDSAGVSAGDDPSHRSGYRLLVSASWKIRRVSFVSSNFLQSELFECADRTVVSVCISSSIVLTKVRSCWFSLAFMRDSSTICSFLSFFLIRHLAAATLFFSKDNSLCLSTPEEPLDDCEVLDDRRFLFAESLRHFGDTEGFMAGALSRLLLAIE